MTLYLRAYHNTGYHFQPSSNLTRWIHTRFSFTCTRTKFNSFEVCITRDDTAEQNASRVINAPFSSVTVRRIPDNGLSVFGCGFCISTQCSGVISLKCNSSESSLLQELHSWSRVSPLSLWNENFNDDEDEYEYSDWDVRHFYRGSIEPCIFKGRPRDQRSGYGNGGRGFSWTHPSIAHP